MAEIRKQLKNVAFGGSWSEQILTDASRDAALAVLARATTECRERDVIDAELHDALDYIRQTIGKGPMLAAAFLSALNKPNPDEREREAMAAFRGIKRWSGG